MGNTLDSTIGLSAVAGSTGSAMQRSTTRSISSGATFSEQTSSTAKNIGKNSKIRSFIKI